MPGTLLVRADASTEIGTGHVMRCLALAQAWREAGGRAVFVTTGDAPAVEKRVSADGFEVRRVEADPGGSVDAAETASQAKELGAEWVVVDGYHFGYDYQRALKDAGLKVLFVDDNGHAGRYCVDIVLNQNIHADESMYADREPHTRLLLGTRYVLLRKEFRAWKDWKRDIPDVARKVLVTLGGGDPENVTLKVAEGLGFVEIDGLEAVIVVGGSNRNYDGLCAAAADSPASIRIQRNVADMAELMAWADVAVSAAGSTCWELAFMGLPAMFVVLADNQRPVLDGLENEDAGLGHGCERTSEAVADALMRLAVATGERSRMSEHGRGFVDGQGARRTVEAMGGGHLSLRPARESDRHLLWEWVNDPEVRRASFSSDVIPWERHVQWFRSRTGDANCVIFIVTNAEQEPVGQVRYEISRDEATISASVSRENRGKRYGAEAIRIACRELFSDGDVAKVHAYVKKGNEPAIRSCRKAGFALAGTAVVKGCEAVHLVLDRNESP